MDQPGVAYRTSERAVQASAAPAAPAAALETLNVENTFVEELPGDEGGANVPRQVHGALWSSVEPTSAGGEPSLVVHSPEVCALLGLDPEECQQPEFAMIMGGAAPLPRGRPYAQCYGGHQFGNWAGQLGDGRAISIGEVAHDGQRWELQLKGAGKTPYSRFADGRAVLRSSIREYVASEAFHHLGIPTTRALSLVATNTEVARDMFYNGDVKDEPGAVVCRVSPSFVRFGTFQLPVSRGEKEAHLVQKVADYVIRHHYAELDGDSGKYLRLLREVVARTARLVAQWQLKGFVHGVLNTDNMSILGVTIDFGPYGFLDKFDPTWTPNLTDFQGRRYCYKNQVEVVQWNLAQLATALLAVDLLKQEDAQEAINGYATQVTQLHNDGMAAKLGLCEYDEALVTTFLKLMYVCEADFTNSFRAMSELSGEAEFERIPDSVAAALGVKPDGDQTSEWPEAERQAAQRAVNPCYIPRQHLLQRAIDAANDDDYAPLNALLEVLQRPFEEQAGRDDFRQPPPPEMVKPGISQLSCSS